MGQRERIYEIVRLLKEKRSVSMDDFVQRLEISQSTIKRDLDLLRDTYRMSIIWDQQLRGYCLENQEQELPRLWFNEQETYALLAAHQLLADIEPGILAHYTAPLRERLQELLSATGHSAAEISRRVKLLPVARRVITHRYFEVIASSLLNRKKLQITAWNRKRDEMTERVVSPQRLVYYRDNWYLDAWCHWRRNLRSFAVETIQSVKDLGESAKNISEKELDEHFGAAYGIFAGKVQHTAVLLFSPERARWVRFEQWHPEQQSELLSDGSYRLSIPYSDEREILMDILRHGSHVTVEAPVLLRQTIAKEISQMKKRYE